MTLIAIKTLERVFKNYYYIIREGDFMMSANQEPMFWRSNKEWYRINKEKDCFELTDKATERAKKSFELYKEMQKKH